MSQDVWAERLAQFEETYDARGKGALSLVVTLTRRWKKLDQVPVDEGDLFTGKGGQVRGLGGSTLRGILADHGIHRRLASEGGRTSRGLHTLAKQYARFVNELHEEGIVSTPDDLEFFESWWIARVREYFERDGFQLQIDATYSISSFVSEILRQARRRQQEISGATILGTVLEHLVGAKLELRLGRDHVSHKPVSTADESSKVSGDFEINDTSIHVTTSPTKSLLVKCQENLQRGRRPIIVCPAGFKTAAVGLASELSLESKIEFYEAQEFISMNINEIAVFFIVFPRGNNAATRGYVQPDRRGKRKRPVTPHSVFLADSLPSSNEAYWSNKIARNKQRERRNGRKLRHRGWHVFVVWECSLSTQDKRISSINRLIAKIERCGPKY